MNQPQQDKKGSDLKLVAPVEMPDYPISASERLDSHYFITWNTKRWRKSNFKRTADPEVGWYGFNLFCEAQDESPVGTLPIDEFLLAESLHISVEHWRRLLDRKVTPLHGWYQVQCDNGEIRLGHKVVTEIALAALDSKRLNKASAEARKLAKQLKDLREMIEQRIGAGQLLKSPVFLDSFNDWIEDRYPNAQRREGFVRRVLDEFQGEMGA